MYNYFIENLSIILTEEYFYDLIGYIAIIFSFFAFATKDKFKMRLNGMFSTLFFGISIAYYNGVNGLFVSIISFITKFLSIFIKEEKLKILKYSSPFIAFLFFYFFNKEGMIGILPAISLVFIIFADLQTDILKMKYIYYGSAFSWLLYAILLGSIPAILFDIVGIITLTVTIFQIKNKNDKSNEKN